MNTIFSKFRIDLVLHSKNQQNFVFFFFFVPSITSNVYTRIEKKRKKKKPETIKSFHEHFEIYRLLLSTPIFRIATRICVRLAPPNVDRSTLRFAACQMRRILLLREWNSRDSNCFWKNFEMRRCYNRRYTSFYSIMSNIYIYICWVGWNILNYLLFICILIIFFFQSSFFSQIRIHPRLGDWKGNFERIRVYFQKRGGGNSCAEKLAESLV